MTSATVSAEPSKGGLLASILDAVTHLGHDPSALSPPTLGSIDHLHTFGLQATLQLATAAGIAQDDVVLDVGCGIGGPARSLATHIGCQIVGVEPDWEMCEVAAELNRRSGFDDLIEIRCGAATALPCDDAEVTVALKQLSPVDPDERPTIYAELRRTLVTGGRLAFLAVVAGERPPVGGSATRLVPGDEVRRLLEVAGFAVRSWQDLNSQVAGYAAAIGASEVAGDAIATLSLSVPRLAARTAAIAHDLATGEASLAQCVAEAV